LHDGERALSRRTRIVSIFRPNKLKGRLAMRIALLAGITLALTTAASAQSLSGDQIRTTLIGNTFSGLADGETYSEHLNADGTIRSILHPAPTRADGAFPAIKSAFPTRKANASRNGIAPK
jgi:hypothetical protein